MPVPQTEPRRPAAAIGVLIAGAIVYGFLCFPAITCRGFPPIDPIWYGFTFAWPIPIVVSAYFDSIVFVSRRYHLGIYAFFTAYFFAGTLVVQVPRGAVNPLGMLVGSLFFGLLHLLIAFVLEFVAQGIYSLGRRLVAATEEENPNPTFSLFTVLCFVAWISLSIGLPTGYRSYVNRSTIASARQQADNDWETNAQLYCEQDMKLVDDVWIEYHVDPETGLELNRRMLLDLYENSYNERIAELIEQRGLPAYSAKLPLPAPEVLIQMLDSADMTPVETFPVDLTDDIHLMRRGTHTRGGSTATSGSDGLSIDTSHGLIGVGDDVLPVLTKTVDGIIYIRNGSDWVGAFLPDGRQLMSASR